jgi:WD40 repeat protein
MAFMPAERVCSKCGAELPTHVQGELCPKCSFVAAVFERADSTIAEVPHSGDPANIGRYKILQKIGEGGCGVVYMAEQEEPVRRRVALKVIKLGMDTEQVVARFEAERQALALMDHPNIARVFDAGATETGRPYFVMELVKGIPVTRYCDENMLSTVTRLSVFIQICQAVQHAHQKGIIHRDIKPSNILVADHDGVPVPKIIDFGIAKATSDVRLTDKTLFTALEQFIGTPAYMSPEQAKLSGLDIDTRSDIYSLGVLLYELLTGKTPFDSERFLEAGLDGIRRIIREEDPPKPSTRLSTLDRAEQTALAKRRRSEPPKLLGMIRGDLDWIVMKCLEKDRTRRYETANGLATDLQRHLNDEAVMARPPDAAYRLQKALSRHRFLFLATGAVAVTLLLGVGVSTWQAIRARHAEAEKEQERRQALENEDRALSLLYASDMLAAQQAIAGGRLDQARKLLKRQLPSPGQRDRRGFEWFYYTHETEGQQAAVLFQQSRPFTGFAVSPDGKMVALRDPEEIKIFDVARREVVQRWTFPEGKVIRFRIAPDGTSLAIGTTNDVELLNIATGQATVLATGRYDVLSFATGRHWIALGRYLLPPREPKVVEIWDYEQVHLLHSILQPGGPLLWWETNSTVLAGLNLKGVLQRWDALTGIQIQEVVADRARPEKHYVAGAVASKAARCVVFQFGPGGGLRVLDSIDGRVISESDWPVQRLVAISEDGRFIASGDGARIRLAEADKLQKYELLAGHLEEVSGVAFIGATSNLVSCGADGRLLFWDPKPPFVIPFDAETNDTNAILQAMIPDVVLSPDQRYCGVYGKLWSLPSGKLVRRFIGVFLGFSPTGAEYATVNSNQLQVWRCADSGTNPAATFRLPATAEDNLLKISPDGRFVGCMNANLNTLVFEARTGKVLANAAGQTKPNSQEEFILGEFLPTSHRLVIMKDPGSTIWDWQAPTNSQWHALSGDFYGASVDGRWIVLRDESRRCLDLIDSEASLKPPIKLEGHTDSIVSVAFSHDAQRLASVDDHNQLRLWKLPEGHVLGIIPIRVTGLCTAAFSMDDQRLYIAGEEGVQALEAPNHESNVRLSSTPKPSAASVPSGSIWSR